MQCLPASLSSYLSLFKNIAPVCLHGLKSRTSKITNLYLNTSIRFNNGKSHWALLHNLGCRSTCRPFIYSEYVVMYIANSHPTKAGGFLGSELTRQLLAQGFNVIGIDSIQTGRREALRKFEGNPKFRTIQYCPAPVARRSTLELTIKIGTTSRNQSRTSPKLTKSTI